MKNQALIVDDSRLACKVMANMLETFDISSHSVFSAEAALEYLQYHQPDIIFLDHTMPGMDGLETIKVIKSNPITATVPVMMYTAKEGEVYVSRARALGAVDVLPKGMEKDYLYNALNKLGLVGKTGLSTKTSAESTASPDVLPNTILPVKQPLDQPQLPIWHSFWQQKIEPFLYRQKIQNSEELRINTHSQTRKLIREFHQTLEHFEHALANRAESHDEFIQAQQAVLRSSRRKKLFFGIALMVLIQLLIIWKLWDLNQLNHQLSKQQTQLTEWKAELADKLDDLNAGIVTLNQHADNNASEAQSPKSSRTMSLVNLQGEVIADVKNDRYSNGYEGVTGNGYYFGVSPQGLPGWPLNARYFMTENCEGDVFVNEMNASVFRDSGALLWYVDKLASSISVTVASRLNAKEECLLMESQTLQLKRLLPNVSYETGIDESQKMELVFTR